MKKIISTILVLAMVLTMALTSALSVSAGTLGDLMEGDYEILNPMAPPAFHAVIYTLSFEKTNLSGGTLTIVDDNFSGIGGTYTYSVDANDVATISVESGNTGNPDAAQAMNFSYDQGGNLLFVLGVMQQYTCVSLSGATPVPSNPELVLGENAIDVTVENNYCTGVNVTFTATEAGTYVLSLADGEENAEVSNFGDPDDWNDDIFDVFENGDYEFTLAAGESITFLVCTTEIMDLTEDTIDIVLTKKGAPAGGGNAGGGSVNTGDNVVLYVAVGAVALASIFGCAIVSKKRVTE